MRGLKLCGNMQAANEQHGEDDEACERPEALVFAQPEERERCCIKRGQLRQIRLQGENNGGRKHPGMRMLCAGKNGQKRGQNEQGCIDIEDAQIQPALYAIWPGVKQCGDQSDQDQDAP